MSHGAHIETDVTEPTLNAGDIGLSAREARPVGDARATIVALHGGGYDSRYWESPLRPGNSLFTLGARLGYRVIAVDRPGYGATHGMVGEAVRIPRQARLLLAAIENLRAEGDYGSHVFVIGHSMGAVLAVHAAAADDDGLVDAIEFSGLPLVFRDELSEPEVLAGQDYMPALPPEICRGLFYGPDGSFDPKMIEVDCSTLARANPTGEIVNAVSCPDDIPRLAPSVTIPVQYTLAEYEMTCRGGRDVLGRGAGLFTNSPRVLTHWQEGSGHNISLHHVAGAYHLRALAFFDEVASGITEWSTGSAPQEGITLSGGTYEGGDVRAVAADA